MITNIKLENFLSYEDVDLLFQYGDVVAVCGNNGVGKSGLLESIAFGLYGVSRNSDIKSLVRIGAKNMSVGITLSGVFSEGDIFEVVRSFKGKKGSLSVFVNGNKVAEGGADPSNNPAQDYIDKALGVSSEVFLLTSFFGFDSSDNILKARPSEQLEALQKFIGIDICNKINKAASESLGVIKSNYEKCKNKIEFINENLANKSKESIVSELDEIKAKIVTTKDTISKLEKSIKDNNVVFEDLQSKFFSFGESIKRLKDISAKKNGLIKELGEAESKLRVLHDRLITVNNQIKFCENDISNKFEEDSVLEEVIKENRDNIIKLRSRLELLTVVKKSGDDIHECPLCFSGVSDEVVHSWGLEREDILSRINNCEKVVSEYETVINKKNKLKDLLSRTVSEKAQIELSISNIKQDRIERLKSEIQSFIKEEATYTVDDSDYNDVNRELVKIRDNIFESEKSLRENNLRLGKLSSEFERLNSDYKSIDDMEAELSSLDSKVKYYTKKMVAYNFVVNAFSRYGIPIELLRDLRNALEYRATQIYKEFKSGSIVIRDTEGARPGIEYCLLDGKGLRPYSSLSKGEKVMYYVAIRVALTNIVSSEIDSKIRFVVLDEVTENLSPENRDVLVKLIGKVVRKHFPQVFMVSHTPLRDIFTKSLEVRDDNGKSFVLLSA